MTRMRVYIYGRLGGDYEVLTVVHSLGAVLAAGVTRAGALSHRLVAVAAIPHFGNCGGWSARASSRDHSIPSAHPARPTHGLTRLIAERYATLPPAKIPRGPRSQPRPHAPLAAHLSPRHLKIQHAATRDRATLPFVDQFARENSRVCASAARE